MIKEVGLWGLSFIGVAAACIYFDDSLPLGIWLLVAFIRACKSDNVIF